MRFPCASRVKTGQVSGGNGEGPASLEISWTLFINFSNAARPFGVVVLSRISASLPAYSPMVYRILEGTSVFETRAVFGDSFHFINKTCIWAHTFTKNWTLLDDLFNRQRIGTLQVKRENKVELKARILTRSRYITAQVNQLGTSWRALQPSKNMDTAGSSGYKVELETRIFTGNRYTTAQINQPWASHNFLYFRL